MTSVRIETHGMTLSGIRHDENHDQFAIAELRKTIHLQQSSLSVSDQCGDIQGRALLVADGARGEVTSSDASRAAVRGVVDYVVNEMPWFHLAEGHEDDVLVAMGDALHNAQSELNDHTRERESTAMTLAFVSWPKLYVSHVGANRCYVRRGNELFRLTTDHVDAPSQVCASKNRLRHLKLWNKLGGRSPALFPESRHFELQLGDILVLITDGVVSEQGSERLRTSINPCLSAEEICGALVGSAGRDDQTAVVARFLPHELGVESPAVSNPPEPLCALASEPRVRRADAPAPDAARLSTAV